MAYMSQERKKELAPSIKAILKKYGVKGTLSVNNHSTLVLTIKEGPIDFIQNYNDQQNTKFIENKHYADKCIDVNTYWYHENYTGVALEFLTEIINAMQVGNHDRSDIQSDYFDVGWYINVHIGRWNEPYRLV